MSETHLDDLHRITAGADVVRFGQIWSKDCQGICLSYLLKGSLEICAAWPAAAQIEVKCIYRTNRTLESLYVEPLANLVAANEGYVYKVCS